MRSNKQHKRSDSIVFARIFLVVYLFLCLPVSTRAEYCFRIWLKDKTGTRGFLDRPLDYLSEKSLARRAKFAIAIDSTDLPVSLTYIRSIEQIGGRCHSQSRWANTVLMVADRYEIIEEYRKLPFIDSIRCVKNLIEPTGKQQRKLDKRELLSEQNIVLESSAYGAGWNQIKMVNGQMLHNRGYKGDGITVAVIDEGFDGVLDNPYLDPKQIVGTSNFVQPGKSVYGEHYHGAVVLSIMASNVVNQMIGTAPEAAYFLLKSEDGRSEYPVEEDYLVAALESADSLGVDLVNISLGYSTFDDPTMDHLYSDFFNPQLFLNIGMRHSADKGLLIVNSAGNERDNPWKKITYPGNSSDVMTVGAVDQSFQPGYFTSEGWVTGESVKPNISAMGVATSFVYSDGTLRQGDGTSFSTPVICGLMACLIQAFPDVTPRQWIERVGSYASNATSPQSLTGYGIPDFERIYQSMNPSQIKEMASSSCKVIRYVASERRIVWDALLDDQPIRCKLYDASGRIVQSHASLQNLDLTALNKGLYTLHVQTPSDRFLIKIVH